MAAALGSVSRLERNDVDMDPLYIHFQDGCLKAYGGKNYFVTK